MDSTLTDAPRVWSHNVKFGLQAKIIVPTLAAIIISMTLASYFSYRKSSEELLKGLINCSQNLVSAVSKGLSTYISDIKNITLSQSRSPNIITMFSSSNPSEDIKRAAFTSLTELKDFDASIQAATLLNSQGDMVLSTDSQTTGNFSERDYFKQAMKGEASISEPLMSKVTGKPVFLVAAPIKSSEKIVGVLYARVDLSKFSEEMIVPVKIGQTGYAFLIDKSGMVFSHPNKDLILKYNISDQDWGKKIISNDKGVADYSFQGIPKSTIFIKEKITGWTVAVTVNDTDIDLSSAAVRDTTLAYSFGGIVLVSMIIIFVVRNVIKDLSLNVSFAGAVADGNLDQKLVVNRRDELGALSESLKTMAVRIKGMIETSDNRTQEALRQTQIAQIAMNDSEQAKIFSEEKTEDILKAANRLEDVVEIVTTASEQLSAQIEQSSRGAEEQAHRIGEAATSMEEMNATVMEVARNASNAASTADQAKVKAEEGSKVVSQVVRGIEQVQHQSQEMKNDMSNLGKQAEGIGQILNVISDIADQTNLLALNAAIEAARAGEAGRGFAVVADEVRKLAEKTMTATKEVGAAIRGIQDGTKKNIDNVERSGTTIQEVTKLANNSGDSLREIVSLAEVTTDQIRSIATASEEQSSASDEINRSIDDVNRVSMETSEAMRQSAHAVKDLAHQAHLLKNLIEEMKTDSGSSSNALPSGNKLLTLGRG